MYLSFSALGTHSISWLCDEYTISLMVFLEHVPVTLTGITIPFGSVIVAVASRNYIPVVVVSRCIAHRRQVYPRERYISPSNSGICIPVLHPFFCSSVHPSALPGRMSRWLALHLAMEAAWLIQHHLVCHFPRSFLVLLLLSVIFWALGPVPTATWFFRSHYCHLVVTAVFRPVILPFVTVPWVLPVISPIVSPGLIRHQRWLHWVPQGIAVCYLDCFSQSFWHFPLQPLPQHSTMPAPLGEPCDGHGLNHALT
jgi:hypothetical protein